MNDFFVGHGRILFKILHNKIHYREMILLY